MERAAAAALTIAAAVDTTVGGTGDVHSCMPLGAFDLPLERCVP